MSTSVKFFTNLMENAPQLANTWGCLVDLLDACLVNGFDQRNITTITRDGATATATVDGPHKYQVNQVLLISGANETEFNGEVRVLSVTTNTFTFTIVTSAPTTATGSIAVKVAPLGFEKVYGELHKGVYRSKNVLSNRPYLRVDNSKAPQYNEAWSKKAKVGMAQGMSDINTVVGAQAPYDPLNPNQNWQTTGDTDQGNVVDGWYKWYYARNGYPNSDVDAITGGNRKWVLVGDDRGFYLFNEMDPSNSAGAGRVGHCFTDFDSYRQGDPFNTLLTASDWYTTASNSWSWGNGTKTMFTHTLDYTGKILMRDHTLLGGNQAVAFTSLNTNNGQTISGRNTGIPFPNPVDYSLILHPTYLMQSGGKGLRGKMPGLMWVHNDNPLQDLEIVENVVGYAGRKFIMIRMHGISTESPNSTMALDITGPWW
ncbi:hypothetical protein UFOVP116_397 [uncultured Caudovirales phage]|uniref:Uncharacterized protein n=1 Tax=uncultured Caudovirales phage TaxID=2100421 RepID=A0A6J5LB98_9CAUD|nr:hypothetical protein UFOVP116_397 [uncultured Caudovirales phage]